MQYPVFGPSETNVSLMLIAVDVHLLRFHLRRKLSQFTNEPFAPRINIFGFRFQILQEQA